MTRTLDEVTGDLGEAYDEWKTQGTLKDDYRGEFFELADEAVEEERGLLTKGELVYGPLEEEARSRVALYFSTYKLVSIEEAEGEGMWEAILEQLPEYLSYTHVNKEQGKVYRRQVTVGALQLEDKLLMAQDLDLYHRVTEFPKWVTDLGESNPGVYDYAFSEDIPRTLKSFDDINPEDLAVLQRYMFEGPPQVKLAAPRKAKPEELEDDS